jgi:hypothetical protein
MEIKLQLFRTNLKKMLLYVIVGISMNGRWKIYNNVRLIISSTFNWINFRISSVFLEIVKTM